jgi:16S rRNA (guanine527-N7)-methyltransferase
MTAPTRAQLLDELAGLVAQTDLVVSAEQQQQLVDYVLLIHKWNQAYNLTAVRDPSEMLVKHIMDSIAVAPLIEANTCIDVGTGPGLPGIPLAIMLPQTQFTLLDTLGKRVRFLQQVVYALKLKNVTPVQSRVEEFVDHAQFDVVLSRAFASLKDMLHWCAHLVHSKGEFLALKGQYPEQEIKECPEIYKVTDKYALTIPQLNAERHVLKITKVG